MDRMKILYIVPYVPDLVRVRPYQLISRLSALGHRVSVATLWSNETEHQTLEQLKPLCHAVYAMKLSRWQSILNCGLTLPTRTPLQAAFCWQPRFASGLVQLIQQEDDPTRFALVEVYRTAEAPASHKETAHFLKWFDTVAEMMAAPRTRIFYTNVFPDDAGW